MQKIKTIILTLAFLFLVSFFSAKIIESAIDTTGNKIAIIPITGALVSIPSDTFFQSPTTSSSSIISQIKKAEEDTSIKAIIFEINSPGGTVVASSDIANSIKTLEKPNIALIREIGTSGAYWIASASDLIIADPMSITGSIGVISSYLEFSGLMEKYGVSYVSLTTARYKDTGNPYEKLTEEERIKLQSKLDKVHNFFVKQVALNRNLTKSEVDELANGLFYLGVEAKELNLVDELGDKEVAVKLAKQLANIKEAEEVTFKGKEKLFDLLSKLLSSSSFYIGQGIGSQLYTDLNTKRDISLIA